MVASGVHSLQKEANFRIEAQGDDLALKTEGFP